MRRDRASTAAPAYPSPPVAPRLFPISPWSPDSPSLPPYPCTTHILYSTPTPIDFSVPLFALPPQTPVALAIRGSDIHLDIHHQIFKALDIHQIFKFNYYLSIDIQLLLDIQLLVSN